MARYLPVILALVVWAVYVALLAYVPWWRPPDPDLPNVAAVLGYNIELAYLLVIGWTVIAGLATAFLMWNAPLPATAPPSVKWAPELGLAHRWAERIVVAVAALVFYWPGALSRFGPHVEDVYFLNVLWRRACDLVAYRDFEFLYGPLMLAPADATMALLGFSMKNYFTYLAVTQMAFYAVLMAILQRYLPKALPRYAAFLLLLPFVVDLLYGLNWIAWRYFGVVFAILILSARPRETLSVLGAGLILGIQAAYSHEYGIAGLIAGLAILGLGLFERGRGRAVVHMIVLAGSAVACWLGLVLLLTGESFSDYLDATALVMREASRMGLGQFAFYWTGHSLALFALLSTVVVTGGIGLARLGRVETRAGDRHLLGALVFALIVLKIGFQRADYLHMAVPFVPLALVLLLGGERRLFATGPWMPRLAMGALICAALAQTIAHLPQGRWVVAGLARGLLHEVEGRSRADLPAEARRGVLPERYETKPGSEALAVRLSAPDLAGRPVLFYGRVWDRAVETGVCPASYAFYDLLYTDERAPMADLAQSTPDMLVALHEVDAAHLLEGGPAPQSSPPELTGLWWLVRTFASPHYDQSYLENAIEGRMWEDALGGSLGRDYRVVDRVADTVLLEPKP